MKSKAPLIMMEQMVMILVFALAAALCLQAFVLSDQVSEKGQARDKAVVLCQNAAEVLQASGGDMAAAATLLGGGAYEEDSLMIDYDKDWERAQGSMRYTLGASRLESGVPGLGSAAVWVRDEAGDEELFRLNVSWQEVIP